MHASAILASLVGLVGLSVAAHGQAHSAHAEATAPAGNHVPAEWADHPHHANNTHSQTKRGALGVYECYGKNWKGPCTWTKADGGSCHNWLYGPSGSMGPDPGLNCRIYVDFNCHDNNNKMYLDWFTAPGIPDYQQNQWLINAGMRNGPMSYKCKKY